jgi:hypothetical protein
MKRKLYPDLSASRERLERNLRHLSAHYCWPMVNQFEFWPTRELLREIQNDVLVLAQRERKKPVVPVWKTFLRVDNRENTLPLAQCVDNLMRRARALLSVGSVLAKAVTEANAGSAQAKRFLSDMVEDNTQKLAELLGADRMMVIQWCNAQALVRWAIDIRHPMAKDLHHIAACLPTAEEIKAQQRREKRRESTRRCRSGKKTSPEMVTAS